MDEGSSQSSSAYQTYLESLQEKVSSLESRLSASLHDVALLRESNALLARKLLDWETNERAQKAVEATASLRRRTTTSATKPAFSPPNEEDEVAAVDQSAEDGFEFL